MGLVHWAVASSRGQNTRLIPHSIQMTTNRADIVFILISFLFRESSRSLQASHRNTKKYGRCPFISYLFPFEVGLPSLLEGIDPLSAIGRLKTEALHIDGPVHFSHQMAAQATVDTLFDNGCRHGRAIR